MFLKSLTIQNKNTIIREINFHKGLNFIVDETPETETQQTGNNVGKTTVLRLVDYCLGSNGKNIYKDTEFQKQPNTIIESFLKNKDNNVLISIVLSEDLEKDDAIEIEISRNFLSYNKKIQKINDINIPNDKEFELELKKYIFNSDTEKPTFRQIISKNIRDEKDKKEKIVKTLGSFGTSEQIGRASCRERV